MPNGHLLFSRLTHFFKTILYLQIPLNTAAHSLFPAKFASFHGGGA